MLDKCDDENLDSLKDRFLKIVTELDAQLLESQKKIAELESKLRIFEFKDKMGGECGSCKEYKILPWKDDNYGYICVSCAVNIAKNQIQSEENE